MATIQLQDDWTNSLPEGDIAFIEAQTNQMLDTPESGARMKCSLAANKLCNLVESNPKQFGPAVLGGFERVAEEMQSELYNAIFAFEEACERLSLIGREHPDLSNRALDSLSGLPHGNKKQDHFIAHSMVGVVIAHRARGHVDHEKDLNFLHMARRGLWSDATPTQIDDVLNALEQRNTPDALTGMLAISKAPIHIPDDDHDDRALKQSVAHYQVEALDRAITAFSKNTENWSDADKKEFSDFLCHFLEEDCQSIAQDYSECIDIAGGFTNTVRTDIKIRNIDRLKGQRRAEEKLALWKKAADVPGLEDAKTYAERLEGMNTLLHEQLELIYTLYNNVIETKDSLLTLARGHNGDGDTPRSNNDWTPLDPGEEDTLTI